VRARLILCRLALASLFVVFGGCASLPSAPEPDRLSLMLSPASLGAVISVQQHIKVERGNRVDALEVALEVDAVQLNLVGLAFAQRVLTLQYDGQTLQSWRHAMLPAQVRGEDVLQDLQLTLWPIEAIRAALPVGWHVEDAGLQRRLSLDNVPVMEIQYSALPRWSGNIELSNLRYGYRLSIQSATPPGGSS